MPIAVKCTGCDREMQVPDGWFDRVRRASEHAPQFVCTECFLRGEEWLKDALKRRLEEE